MIRRIFKAGATLAVIGFACGNAAGQGVTKIAPLPNPNITLAAPRGRAPSAGHALPGRVEGFVYWDTHEVTHNPAGRCDGLSVNVFAGGKVLAAPTNQFGASSGQVKAFLATGTIAIYDVCSYAFDNLPENTPLRIELVLTQPAAFSSAVAPAKPTVGPLTIINARCNMLPSATPPTWSDLNKNWGSCQDVAFDVNFELVPESAATRAATLQPRSATLLQTAPGVSGGAKSSSSGGTLLNPGTQTTLLSGSQGGTGQSIRPLVPRGSTNGNSGTGAGNGTTDVQPLSPRGGSNSGPSSSGGSGAAGGTNAGITDGTKNADDLNPQPYPPKRINTAGAGVGAGNGRFVPPSKALKAKLGVAKKGPAIVNRAAASHVGAMATVLQNQRNSANKEAAQMMKLGIRPAAQPNVSLGPSQTMSASTTASAMRANRTAANAQIGATTQVTGSSNSQQMMKLSPVAAMENLALACSHDTTMRIVGVSGNEGPITFTTDPSGNFYTISGCSFGNIGPTAKVYIYYQNSFHQPFQIQQWNDNYIQCNLDPNLTSVSDVDNLTLVVQRSDGQQAVKTGFKFYAMRATLPLAVFPKQYFSLDKFNLQDVSNLTGAVYSPVDPTGYFPNNTAEVTWYDPDLAPVKNKNFVTPQSTPPTGTDIYDFSHLAPGFEPTSAYISSPDPGAYCSSISGGELTVTATSGTFGGNWNGSQLWITWQGWNCKMSGDTFFEPPVTDYAVDVFVEGPRGLDPWSGQPIGH